ncbi:MAG TPA: hypothetical protein VLD39_12825 [Gammaproteobacteria bacterium]|nr:hypothetical protein [Gammaproteobacteria bacterium]
MRARSTWILASFLLLAGCEALQESGTREPAPAIEMRRPVSDVESLLLYSRHLGRLKEDQLGRELEIARAAYAREGSEFNRVRLAMLLGQPNTPLTDNARALELLEPVVKNQTSEFSALASLLAAQLQERKRLDANTQDLQKKLDALKSLERSMMERKR